VIAQRTPPSLVGNHYVFEDIPVYNTSSQGSYSLRLYPLQTESALHVCPPALRTHVGIRHFGPP